MGEILIDFRPIRKNRSLSWFFIGPKSIGCALWIRKWDFSTEFSTEWWAERNGAKWDACRLQNVSIFAHGRVMMSILIYLERKVVVIIFSFIFRWKSQTYWNSNWMKNAFHKSCSQSPRALQTPTSCMTGMWVMKPTWIIENTKWELYFAPQSLQIWQISGTESDRNFLFFSSSSKRVFWPANFVFATPDGA